MRFIITQHGENLIKVIGEEQTSDKAKDLKSMQNSFSANYSKLNNTINDKKSKSPFSRKTIKQSHSQARIIEIHQKRLNIPKTINEKYNNPNRMESTSLILPELPKNLNTRNRNLSINFENSSSSINGNSEVNSGKASGFKLLYPLREVINDNTYFNIKHDLKAFIRGKDKMTTITENDFRSIYKERSEVQEVEDILNTTKVDTGKVNLIQYLNTKKTISHKFLKSLSEASDDKINKINKCCQIIANENESNQLNKNIIQTKIKNKYIKDKKDCQELFFEMENNIDIYKKICSENTKSFNPSRNEKFYELHKDFQKKYWNKFNVDILQRRNNNILHVSKQSSSHDINNLNENNINIK